MNVAAGVMLRPAACLEVRTAKPDQHGAVRSDWEDIKVFTLRLTVSLSLFHISWCVTMTTASNIFCRRVTEKPTQPFSGCCAWLWVINQSLRLTTFTPAQDYSATNISPARCVSLVSATTCKGLLPAASNSKHWFTTSFLGRRCWKAGDARSALQCKL